MVNLAIDNNVAGPEILQFAIDEGVDPSTVGTRKGKFAMEHLLRQDFSPRALEILGVLLLSGCSLPPDRPRPTFGNGWNDRDALHLLRVFGVPQPPFAGASQA